MARPPFRASALGAVERGRAAYVVYTLAPREALGPHSKYEAWLASLTDEERDFARDGVTGPVQTAPARRQPDRTWRLVADHDFLGAGSMMIGFELGSGPGDESAQDQPDATM